MSDLDYDFKEDYIVVPHCDQIRIFIDDEGDVQIVQDSEYNGDIVVWFSASHLQAVIDRLQSLKDSLPADLNR